MICKNCHTENITKAKFCQHCGSAFTDEQREEAYDRTISGMIDKLEKWKGYITLEAITGHPVFKTLILVAILIWGLLLGRTNGNQMLILESEAYRVREHLFLLLKHILKNYSILHILDIFPANEVYYNYNLNKQKLWNFPFS